MKLFLLAFKNLLATPVKTLFNIILVALSVSLVLATLLIEQQYNNHIEHNLAKVDLILSAKGSPLQSVLCNLYQIDFPTGNIPVKEIAAFLNPQHPIIKESLPLSLGDNYDGFRITGTTDEFMSFYNLTLNEGKIFESNTQAVIGSEVARLTGLKKGTTFKSGHGLLKDELNHSHKQDMTVCGILLPSNTIADKLIFVPISNYWLVHNHEEEDSTQDLVLKKDSLRYYDKEITSLLVRFRGTNVQSLNFGRTVNENTGILAASPPFELNRLYQLTGSASDLLKTIGIIIAVMAVISIVINLFQALRDRRLELALVRLQGGTRSQVMLLVLIEGLLIVVLGILVASFCTHFFLDIYSHKTNLFRDYGIQGWIFVSGEMKFLIVCAILGFITCIIPAISAYKLNLHKILKY